MELKNRQSLPLNESSTPPMRCCVRLCCKSMMYRPDERPGVLHFSDTQIYWCNVTRDPVGPDQRQATPKVCQPGRTCYVAEE